MYSRTLQGYEAAYQDLISNEVCTKYQNFLLHLENNYFSRPEKWASYFRIQNELPTNQVNTNNLVEASFVVLKDITFNRCKAQNLAELVDIMLKDDSSYYKDRLINVGNSRFSEIHYLKNSRYKFGKIEIGKEKIVQITDEIYFVECEKDPEKFYQVSMRRNECQCGAAINRGPCKHKASVAYHFGDAQLAMIPETDPKARALYHFLATGTMLENDWYRQFDQPAVSINVQLDTDTDNDNLRKAFK